MVKAQRGSTDCCGLGLGHALRVHKFIRMYCEKLSNNNKKRMCCAPTPTPRFYKMELERWMSKLSMPKDAKARTACLQLGAVWTEGLLAPSEPSSPSLEVGLRAQYPPTNQDAHGQRAQEGIEGVHSSPWWHPPWCLSTKERMFWYISIIPASRRPRQVYALL